LKITYLEAQNADSSKNKMVKLCIFYYAFNITNLFCFLRYAFKT